MGIISLAEMLDGAKRIMEFECFIFVVGVGGGALPSLPCKHLVRHLVSFPNKIWAVREHLCVPTLTIAELWRSDGILSLLLLTLASVE
uniref:Uncharacterized protein n=1 Tax=Rhizophora mucronata TaxID=61149 RepID=A0A2P2IR32_RHIMU